jgi:hypothetical protein
MGMNFIVKIVIKLIDYVGYIFNNVDNYDVLFAEYKS